jgi:hypothetical protein
MNVTLTLDLDPALARRAGRRGLLTTTGISTLLERELGIDKPARSFRDMVASLRSKAAPEMTLGEIQQEVDTYRTLKRSRTHRS